MSDERVKLTVDGKTLEAPKGEMLMRATDEAGIYIPRFCYHKNLRVVANCRMCLVEVKGAPKPMPACATPVADGMEVFTGSGRAIDAQRSTMEFLLINHPLDCPVCDQGGECELQDLSWGYGRGVSRFAERKRVVRDKSIGPLVHTAMTRCIHCTRCIRVLEEVGGRQEMGATERGEHLKIGTWIERSIDSELSGNIIDVCPVGALNDKPFKMRARGWELLQHATVSAHDCAGSNIYGHSLRGRFLRAVPRENESINDCWISDRDRWSHTGLAAADRVKRPLVRRDGALVETDWEEALAFAAESLRGSGEGLGTLVAPGASLEEMYLAQKLTRGLGSRNVDARLRQSDFRDDEGDPRFPSLGSSFAALEKSDAILLVGSHLTKEVPIAGYRVRRAAQQGAAVMALNPRRYDFAMPLTGEHVVHPDRLVAGLAAFARAVAKAKGRALPDFLEAFADADDTDLAANAGRFAEAERPRILLGHLAHQHPRFADLRRLAVALGALADAPVGYLSEGANLAGAYLAGAVPHRGPGGVPVAAGLDVRAMLAEPRKVYLTIGTEPEKDCWDGATARAALAAARVVALTSFLAPAMREYADCVLPLAAFGETAGSYVNAAGDVQRFDAAAVPAGDSRQGWKILRALGAELVAASGFGFTALAEVRAEVMGAIGHVHHDASYGGQWRPAPGEDELSALRAVTEVGLYAGEPLLRRAAPLQATADANGNSRAWLHPDDAAERGLESGDRLRIAAGASVCEAELGLDSGVVHGSLWVPPGSGLALWESAVTLAALPQAAEA
ncbi:MAG TPA: NADH-quinone oxidoreductase subunit NuoG [Gammaproteobacteria bacterium]|nr:NADH-quinone oxidoreductase subunit NuoG [Gammaproteobacteria bacterium]